MVRPGTHSQTGHVRMKSKSKTMHGLVVVSSLLAMLGMWKFVVISGYKHDSHRYGRHEKRGVDRSLGRASRRCQWVHAVHRSGDRACTGSCLTVWPPLDASTVPTASAGASQAAIALSAGQVTYNGHLLYYFESDTAPGQATGTGVSGFTLVTP